MLSTQNSETTICDGYLLWKICLDDHVEYDSLCGSEIELNGFVAFCFIVAFLQRSLSRFQLNIEYYVLKERLWIQIKLVMTIFFGSCNC